MSCHLPIYLYIFQDENESQNIWDKLISYK
jgi:hypothetical protein